MMSPSIDSPVTRSHWAALGACLLDFQAYPGRYPLALREPRLLFDHGTAVLTLASGRAAEGLPQDDALQDQLRNAARYFVRTAMLRPGADHYTLMGLRPGFDPAMLREHYRMLMRLTHPDFAGGARVWPPDAATRINQANDVLSSSVNRQNYDRTLGDARQQWRPVQKPPFERPDFSSPARHGVRHLFPAGRRWVFGGLVAGVLLLGFWSIRDPGEPESVEALRMVQRPREALQSSRSDQTPLQVDRMAISPSVPTPVPAAPTVFEQSATMPVLPAQPQALSRVAEMDARAPAVAIGELRPASRSSSAPEASRVLAAPTGRGASSPALVRSPSATTVPSTVAAAVTSVRPIPVPIAASLPISVGTRGGTGANPGGGAELTLSASAPPAVGSVQAVRLSMDDVQQLLGNVLAAMHSGSGDQVLRWVERSSRPGDGADGFVRAYNRAVGNARTVRVGAVRFNSRPSGEGLLVDGVVLLHLEGENRQASTQELVLRAQFASRGGQAVLTRLNASETGQ